MKTQVLAVKVFALTAFLFLAACGGGSSGGGGEGSTQVTGSYSGTETLTITFQGESQTNSGPITITIAGNGEVTVVDGGGTVYRGNINDLSFTATGGITGLTDPDVPGAICDFTQTYVGTVDGNTISGTASGNISCRLDGGATFSIPFSGSFTATRNP